MGCNTPNLFKYEIIHVNIRGAKANRINLTEYLSNANWPEVITLNETKLGSESRFDLVGYKCAARKESARTGGSRGSMILVKEEIMDVIEVEETKRKFQHDEVIGIEIKSSATRPGIKIFTYYNPPSTYVNTNIIDYVNDLQGNCVLTGDLNCKNLTWGSSITDTYGEELQESINRSYLFVCNDGSKTRCDPVTGREEVLDIIIHNFNATPLFQKFWVGDDVGSDHYPIHATYQFKSETNETAPLERRIENTDWRKFEDELETFASNYVMESNLCKEDIDLAVETISSKILNSFHNACPLRERRTKKKFKFTAEIREKVKEKRQLRREKSSAASHGDWVTVRYKMMQMNRIGNDIKKIQRQQRKNELEQHCENLSKEKNSRNFFQTFKKLSDPIINTAPGPSNSQTITNEYGENATTLQEKANIFAKRLQEVHEEPNFNGFNEDFKESVETYLTTNKKLFNVEPSTQYTEPEHGDSSDLLREVTAEEVKETLKNCKTRSAVGLDEINYQILKKLPETFYILIAALFSCCFQTGYFPDKWKEAKTILIPKPGKDSKSVKNHRPISLLSCTGKILERILARRLSMYMEKEKLFAPTQCGFRKGRMTAEHILNLTEKSFTAFKKQQTVASIFLDAEMAFDKCWQNGIRYKLKKSLDLPDRYIRILSSFLTNRSLKVYHNGFWSRKVTIRAGTPQGSPLSPLLYLIMVNDIPSSITTIGKLFQYADDIALAAFAYTFDAARLKLQQMINILEGWCRRWRIMLNGDKSNFLKIHRINDSTEEDQSLQLFHDMVQPKTHAKFLGVELDSKLTFTRQITEICSKASKRLAVLRFLSRAGTEPRITIRLYKIYVRSLFESGSIAFIAASKAELEKLQKIQNAAIRTALRLPSYISIKLLHESSGLPMLQDRLRSLNSGLIKKMCSRNPDIQELIEEHQVLSEIYSGQYKSPLDKILC